MIVLEDIEITLNPELILKGQGVRPDKAGSTLYAEAEEILEEIRDVVAPAALFDVFKVKGKDYQHHSIELEDGGIFEGKFAVRTLAGSKEVALGVCTIGAELENLSEELFRRDPVKAMAYTGGGIAALRLTSEALLAEIRKKAADKGWGSGMRAQPGQEGWPIEQQQVIFDRLPVEKIGVRLTESGLMIPKNSVSSVVGMGPEMHPDGIACDYCSRKKHCPWRIED